MLFQETVTKRKVRKMMTVTSELLSMKMSTQMTSMMSMLIMVTKMKKMAMMLVWMTQMQKMEETKTKITSANK